MQYVSQSFFFFFIIRLIGKSQILACIAISSSVYDKILHAGWAVFFKTHNRNAMPADQAVAELATAGSGGGTGTGISAKVMADLAQVMADPAHGSADLVQVMADLAQDS
jgi:hypothetical protein